MQIPIEKESKVQTKVCVIKTVIPIELIKYSVQMFDIVHYDPY